MRADISQAAKEFESDADLGTLDEDTDYTSRRRLLKKEATRDRGRTWTEEDDGEANRTRPQAGSSPRRRRSGLRGPLRSPKDKQV